MIKSFARCEWLHQMDKLTSVSILYPYIELIDENDEKCHIDE